MRIVLIANSPQGHRFVAESGDVVILFNAPGVELAPRFEKNRKIFAFGLREKVPSVPGIRWLIDRDEKIKEDDMLLRSDTFLYAKDKVPSSGFTALRYLHRTFGNAVHIVGWTHEGAYSGHDYDFERNWCNDADIRRLR